MSDLRAAVAPGLPDDTSFETATYGKVTWRVFQAGKTLARWSFGNSAFFAALRALMRGASSRVWAHCG